MFFDIDNAETQELIKAINNHRVLGITGAGVTNATLNDVQRKEFGSWTALLHYGLNFCEKECRAEAEWLQANRKLLSDPAVTAERLLDLGDSIWHCLSANGKIEEWLDIFDSAHRENADLILAIKRLGIPIATANYDKLLEDITLLTPIALHKDDYAKIQEFARASGTPKYILHLHGFYKYPDSIVLGKASYERIVKNEYAQFISRHLVANFDIVVFLGFGKGLYDPNFSLLFEWVSKWLPGTKMMQLVTNGAVRDTQKIHEDKGSKNVVVMGYGDLHSDLTSYIQQLSLHIDRKEDFPKSLPGKPHCIGRKAMIDNAADYLTEAAERPLGIIGGAGLGKTNLIINILYHKKVNNKFGRYRYFFRCDGCTSLDLLLTGLLNLLDISIGENADPESAILNYMQYLEEDKLLVLDNFETPWDHDKDRIKFFIGRLQTVTRLAFTMRGGTGPAELDWECCKVDRLKAQDAATLFHNSSDRRFEKDPLVMHLVEHELDCLPLAVELIGKRARGAAKLETILDEWHRQKTLFLQLPGMKNKSYNLEVSIQLSLDSPRLTDDDKAFLKAICFFPMGLRRDFLSNLFDKAFDLLETQIFAGLCEEDPLSERISVLSPVREYILKQAIKDEKYLLPILSSYLALASAQGKKIGDERKASGILKREWPNVVKALDYCLDTEEAIRSLVAVTTFANFAGKYITDLLKRAVVTAEKSGDKNIIADAQFCLGISLYEDYLNRESGMAFHQALIDYGELGNVVGKADCLQCLGDLAFRQSDFEEAKSLYQQAASLHDQHGDLLGKANCYHALADLELRTGHNNEAKSWYEKALQLFSRTGNLVGEAHCYMGFADLSFFGSDDGKTKDFYLRALLIYQDIVHYQGEANALLALGEIEFRQSNGQKAERYYRDASSLYAKIGSLLGNGNCIRCLADLAFRESRIQEAEDLFKKAMALYDQVPDLLGKANCLKGLGNIALENLSDDKAKEYFLSALALYERTSHLSGIAGCFLSLGILAINEYNYDEASSYFNRAMPLYEQRESMQGKANCLSNMGILAYYRSQPEQANACFRAALTLFEQLKSVLGKANCLRNLGSVALKERQFDSAENLYLDAKELYDTQVNKYSQGLILVNLGALYREKGDDEKAQENYRGAIKIWRAAGYENHIADFGLEEE